MTCRARQYSDQMSCMSCGLVWDTNDPDPPECRGGNALFDDVPGHATLPQAIVSVELRPGAVNYAVTPKGNKHAYVETNIDERDVEDYSLAEFAELIGYKLGPWQRQFLEELDRTNGRGLPNKG